ncbi:MAG: tetratricopeptide repeat protein [Bacteroidales bacterium]|nr:tetratricopeptide repeat protein [Bacteroidales bacterium]
MGTKKKKHKPEKNQRIYSIANKNFNIWALVLILLAGFLTYLPSLWYSFSPMDDYWLIVKKFDFLSNFSNLPVLFTQSMTEVGYSANYYRPIFNLTFMIEAVIGGEDPLIFHLGNVLIHTLNGLILFYLLKELINSNYLSLLFSLLFLVHPVNAQAVGWIPGRSDTLMTFFFFTCFLTFIIYLKKDNYIHLSIGFICFLLALLSKETAVIFPFVIGVYYLTQLDKPLKSQKFIIVLSGFVIVFLFWYIIRSSVVGSSDVDSQTTIFRNITNYLFPGILAVFAKMFFPLNSPLDPFLSIENLIIGAFVLAIIILVAAVKGFRDKKMAIIGMAWTFLFILPPLVIKGGTNEHWIYVSLPGFFVFLNSLRWPAIKINKRILFLASLVLIVLFAFRANARSTVYKDYDNFLDAAISGNPNYAMYYDMRGALKKSRGKYNEALEDYSNAIRINPKKVTFYLRRATLYAYLKKKDKALKDFTTILKLDSINVNAFFLRANLLAEQKNYKNAIGDYSNYIRLALKNASITKQDISYSAPGSIKIAENVGVAFNNTAIYSYYLENYNEAMENVFFAQKLGYPVSRSFLDSLAVRYNEFQKKYP